MWSCFSLALVCICQWLVVWGLSLCAPWALGNRLWWSAYLSILPIHCFFLIYRSSFYSLAMCPLSDICVFIEKMVANFFLNKCVLYHRVGKQNKASEWVIPYKETERLLGSEWWWGEGGRLGLSWVRAGCNHEQARCDLVCVSGDFFVSKEL